MSSKRSSSSAINTLFISSFLHTKKILLLPSSIALCTAAPSPSKILPKFSLVLHKEVRTILFSSLHFICTHHLLLPQFLGDISKLEGKEFLLYSCLPFQPKPSRCKKLNIFFPFLSLISNLKILVLKDFLSLLNLKTRNVRFLEFLLPHIRINSTNYKSFIIT